MGPTPLQSPVHSVAKWLFMWAQQEGGEPRCPSRRPYACCIRWSHFLLCEKITGRMEQESHPRSLLNVIRKELKMHQFSAPNVKLHCFFQDLISTSWRRFSWVWTDWDGEIQPSLPKDEQDKTIVLLFPESPPCLWCSPFFIRRSLAGTLC